MITAIETYFKINAVDDDNFTVIIIDRQFVVVAENPVAISFTNSIEFKNQYFYGTAGQNLLSNKIVAIVNGAVVYADNTDISQYNKVIGMTVHSANTGDEIKVLTDGYLDGMSITIDSDYFVGINGDMTTVVPSGTVYLQNIGFGINATTLMINLDEPLLLN